ncbi:MAG: hypothetical protein GX605_12750 [Chloroflexi bacterium]|nr:hypothetical protein [Chloroflexota bacterium]
MFTQEDLQELVEFASEAPPVVSLYLVVDPAAGTKEEHKLTLRGLLKEASAEASPSDIEAIERFFDFGYDWQSKAVALFSCQGKGFWRQFGLYVPAENRVHVGRRPYIKPLTNLRDRYGRYGVVLVDREGARLFQFEMGRLREATGTLGDEVKRHKQGGYAASRYQRRADEQAMQNLRQAADLTSKFLGQTPVSHLLIGGTADTVAQFQPLLPKALQGKVAGTLALDILASESEVQERTLQLIWEVEEQRAADLVERMVTTASKGGAATLGLGDTLMALQQHQVHVLVVDEGYEQPGYRCQACGYISADHSERCPICQGDMVEVDDAVETAVRRALELGAEVEVVRDNEALQKLGGIGALLRY